MASTVALGGSKLFPTLRSACRSWPRPLLVRCIAGKAMRTHEPKPAPFPYETTKWSPWRHPFEKTTLRFDENTKIVVVDGAHGVGKSTFAKELAEELDMKYMPPSSMDFWYKGPYPDQDLRDWNDYLMPRNKTFDDRDFVRNPLGTWDGQCDRFLYMIFIAKYHDYYSALRHVFNTGQGVVMEKSVFSDYVYWDAAYNAGWILKETQKYMEVVKAAAMQFLLRPNLIIYLDAPVHVVQQKIKERDNEWDRDSPLWKNAQYLSDIYNGMKRNYLVQAKPHSEVLIYDWTEPGETELVVEDIERLNLDYFGTYEEQQSDWRLWNEEEASRTRRRYESQKLYSLMVNHLSGNLYFESPHVFRSSEEARNLAELENHVKGARFAYGFNPDMGDKNIAWKWETNETFFKTWQIFPSSDTPLRPSIPTMSPKKVSTSK